MKKAGYFWGILIYACFLPVSLASYIIPETPIMTDTASPNVIIIFMDDMGYGDLEAYGGFPYHTPNINKLAAEGMRFTNFYAAQAVCSASRAGLMTGCYPNRIGISGALFPDSKIALNPEEETLAELFKAKGYATGMAGKWHLGQREPFLPLQNGFDEYLGLPYSNDMWPVGFDGRPADTGSRRGKFPPLPLIENNKARGFIQTISEQSELTSIYTGMAVNFIQKNKRRPFFLYLAHTMPHAPIAASDKFKGKSSGGLYGDVMEEIDWSVGEIMRTLDATGLTKNTLLIFTSDNGPWLTYGNHGGNTGGLREGKGTAWEGGVRVPCIMRWPGHIPAGTVNNKMAATIDILPTMVNLCKLTMPVKKIDGLDISPLLMNQMNVDVRDEFVYYYDKNSLKGIRKGQWKLVFPCISQTYKKISAIGADGWPGTYASDSVYLALYDLRTDPGETLDVKERFPEVVRQLTKLADRYRQELGDDLTKTAGTETRAAASVE